MKIKTALDLSCNAGTILSFLFSYFFLRCTHCQMVSRWRQICGGGEWQNWYLQAGDGVCNGNDCKPEEDLICEILKCEFSRQDSVLWINERNQTIRSSYVFLFCFLFSSSLDRGWFFTHSLSGLLEYFSAIS